MITIIRVEHKKWARHMAKNAGGEEVCVERFRDESTDDCIDLFISENDEGAVIATVGLMEYNQSPLAELDIRSEVIMDMRGGHPAKTDVLCAIAYGVIRGEYKLAHGIVLDGLMDRVVPGHALPHILCITPFQWEQGMDRVEIEDQVIHPLVALPISTAEKELVDVSGVGALEQRWIKNRCDVLDWGRGGDV